MLRRGGPPDSVPGTSTQPDGVQVADDGVVADALASLRAQSPRLAQNAEAAFDSLTWGEGLGSIGARGVADFLWYQLPTKWLCELDERLEIAVALGRLFELVDLPRYQAMCLAPETAEIIAAYERKGRADGLAAYRKAVDAAGLEPPDVPGVFAWGSVMGVQEANAYHQAADTLELAVAAGGLTPGGRGWRKTARDLTTRHLTVAQLALDGGSWLEAIHSERLAVWADARGAVRGGLTAAVLDQLSSLSADAVPEGAAAAVEPIRWLLSHAAEQDGIPLTANHTLNRAMLAEAAARLGWLTSTGRPRSENDLPQAWTLRAVIADLGLLRRVGRRLVLTPAGRTLAQAELSVQWATVVPALIPAPPPEAFAGEIALMMRLTDPAHEPSPQVIAQAMAEEGWQTPNGQPPQASSVSWWTGETTRRVSLFGFFDQPLLDRGLTAAGRAGALTALQARALRPRRSVQSG